MFFLFHLSSQVSLLNSTCRTLSLYNVCSSNFHSVPFDLTELCGICPIYSSVLSHRYRQSLYIEYEASLLWSSSYWGLCSSPPLTPLYTNTNFPDQRLFSFSQCWPHYRMETHPMLFPSINETPLWFPFAFGYFPMPSGSCL